MSTTTRVFADDGVGPESHALVKAVREIHSQPYAALWHAFTGKPQRWVHNLVHHTLTYNPDAKAYTLTHNNLVA